MGPKFFQTIMGQRFIEGTVPKILSELKRLNDNLELINKRLEMLEESSQNSDEDQPQ